MHNFHLNATADTPEIHFDFNNHHLSIAGEAYPENAALFFHPILISLKEYFNTLTDATVKVTFHLTYFNSASTKMLYTLFDLLDTVAAQQKNSITLQWLHDEEDDAMQEFGMDAKSDFSHVEFIICSEANAR